MSAAALSFQSTRPRGARHGTFAGNNVGYTISIHAPAWGATRCNRRLLRLQPISIHAPAWGATAKEQTDAELAIFQSTRPRGARRNK